MRVLQFVNVIVSAAHTQPTYREQTGQNCKRRSEFAHQFQRIGEVLDPVRLFPKREAHWGREKDTTSTLNVFNVDKVANSSRP